MANRYWVGGSGTWNATSTTNWSATSGGSGGASVPTAADSVFFDQAGTYTVTFVGTFGAIGCLDFNVSAGSVTFAGAGSFTISGNMSITNVTPTWSATGMVTFNATSAKTITSNGTVFDCAITFDGVGGSWALNDALTIGSTRTITLTNGTLSLGNNTLTCGIFSSSNSNTRTLDFGTGNINLTGSSTTIYFTNALTNLTILPATGPRQVITSYSGSTGTRGFGTGSGINESFGIDISVIAGSDTVGLSSARNIDFTGFSGTWNNSTRTIYGNLTLSSTMTLAAGTGTTTFGGTSATPNTITTKGQVLDFPITINSVGGTKRLQDALTIGTSRTFTLINGILDLNNNNLTVGTLALSGTNARAITFGTGRIVTTNSNAISAGTLTNFTLSGTPRVDVTATSATFNVGQVGATESNVFDIYVIGSGPFPNGAVNQRVGTLSLANATGAFTFTSGFGIYRDLILSPSVDPVSYSASLTFLSTSATPRSVTSNGRTMDFPVTFNGIDGTWVLQDAMLLGSNYALTLTNGTLDLNGKTLTAGTSFAIAAGTKSVTFNGGVIVCPASTTTAFNNAAPTNFTTSAGSAPGKISMTGASAKTFVGGGSTYAATLNQGGAGVLTVTGSNTFADITATNHPATITLTAGTTTSLGNLTLMGGSLPGTGVTLNSTGVNATISKSSGLVSVKNCTISYISATGGAKFRAPINLGNVDAGSNSGWDFSGWNPTGFMPFMTNSFRA